MRLKDRVKNNDNRGRAYSYLLNKGVQPHIAAGILGNFAVESGDVNLNVNAYNPDDLGKPSIGLAQWRGDRKQKYEEFVGEDNSLENQLDFMLWELENTENRAYQKLQETTNPEEAALAFSRFYERPHKDYAHNDRRISYANEVFNAYSDKNVYATNRRGDTVNIDPSTATQQQIDNSDFQKQQFQSLTNYDVPQENRTFAQQEGQKTASNKQENNQQIEAEDPWKKKLKEKIQQRQNLVNLIGQGYLDTQTVEYNRPQNTVQRIQQSYMQDGGTITVDSEDDPRYQAYRDSLNLYNISNNAKQEVLKKEIFKDKFKEIPYKELDGYRGDNPLDGYWEGKEGIKPTKILVEEGYEGKDIGIIPLYKKPTIPERARVSSVGNINPEGIQMDNRIRAEEFNHIPDAPLADSFDVEERVRTAYGGDNVRRYRTEDEERLLNRIRKFEADETSNTRGVNNQLIIKPIYQNGGQIPVSSEGLRKYPRQQVRVPVENGRVTMKNIDYPVLGISDQTGQEILMQPNKEYYFPETQTVLEIPQI